ncbi:hypothetical protein L3Q82_002180 [Scortum barcoo]|uniref:Uncharacterized protein n=1 Tax=Scortum barcoo TaxID=214431 RepID=A0ACB8W3Q7_9TELE|nr:hypothetical protein L3Q82_002180 [Scortum barcoo]
MRGFNKVRSIRLNFSAVCEPRNVQLKQPVPQGKQRDAGSQQVTSHGTLRTRRWCRTEYNCPPSDGEPRRGGRLRAKLCGFLLRESTPPPPQPPCDESTARHGAAPVRGTLRAPPVHRQPWRLVSVFLRTDLAEMMTAVMGKFCGAALICPGDEVRARTGMRVLSEALFLCLTLPCPSSEPATCSAATDCHKSPPRHVSNSMEGFGTENQWALMGYSISANIWSLMAKRNKRTGVVDGKEANQDLMRNSSLQARTESFFIHQARQMPFVNASYGPLSVQQPVPLEMLQTLPGPFNTPSFTSSSVPTSALSPLFTFNWKVHTYIISERIHPSWPKVQVLFYIAGRDWDDYSAIHKLPCVRMFAFHETQEVRGTCRLKGELGICVAELEPLASWFSPPTVRPGRQRISEQAQGTPVELYYMVQTTDSGDCSSEDSRKGSSVRTDQQRPMGYFAGHTPMQRIGSVRLFQPLSELKLDNNFVVMAPSKPIRQRETVSTFLALSMLSSVQIFTLRVKLKDGVAFLGARASNPVVWTVSPDVRSEGHRVVILHCRRKENSFSQSRVDAAGYQRVLQVDLEVNGLMVTQGEREVTWQVEYPLTRTLTGEVPTLIRLAPQDLGGIVPLAMDTEILNTAVLTGRTVAVPVKVVTVGTDGAVSDVTESVECKSTDEQVIKVSERCDYVYVNGKETRGKSRVMLNFTYSFLSAQLEMSVWMPRLPLLIDVADPELSQIKGWRVPVSSGNRRYERVTDDRDEDDAAEERTEGGCAAQYQSTTLRVLTHFVADSGEVRGVAEEDGQQQNFLLGSDWQVEVTQLVKESLRVEDLKVAQLLDGQVLIGLSAGTTKLQVRSPLTSSVLAERSIRVLDDKVSVTELGVQLVSGLALSLQLSPGSNRAIVATATTQEVIESLKQEEKVTLFGKPVQGWIGVIMESMICIESLISAWLQFSDGSMTPLDNYNPDHFTLAATSLDERVVAVQRSGAWKWPIIVAKGEGQGLLVRVEMSQTEMCQKGKRHAVLATGMANIQVRFGQPEDQYRQPGERRTRPDPPYYGGSISDMETGLINRGATTIRGHVPVRPNGGRLSMGGQRGEGPKRIL